jgi:hypothetical protein
LHRVMRSAEATGFHVRAVVDAPASQARRNQEVFIDLGWGAEQAMTTSGQQHIPASHDPTLSLSAPSGNDVGERG